MPNSRHRSVIASPSRWRATKRKRSSITEQSLHGINTSSQKRKSVTYVPGTFCYLCLRSVTSSRLEVEGSNPFSHGFLREAVAPRDSREVPEANVATLAWLLQPMAPTHGPPRVRGQPSGARSELCRFLSS